MINVKVDSRGKKIMLDIQTVLLKKHKDGLRQAFHNIGLDVRRETRKLIRTGIRTGKMYGTHQASAPGEPPANLTGKLARSVNFKVHGWRRMTVGESAPYAGILEEGGGMIEPRPHLIVAIQNTERDTVREFEQSLLRTTKH